MKRIAVVTGSNKGIGLEIVKLLASLENYHVILTARNSKLGQQAIESLGFDNVEFFPLDLNDEGSIVQLSQYLKSKYGGVDVVVNNAAISTNEEGLFLLNKGEAPTVDVKTANDVIGTNYFGTKNVCNHLLPLIREGGRLVNVSSGAGSLATLPSQELKIQFNDDNLTIVQLDNLVNQFYDAVKDETYISKGWPKTAYSVSKIAVNSLTRILARDEKRNHILINSSCPGHCQTDLSPTKDAPRTSTDGAKSIVAMVVLSNDSKIHGKFTRDGNVIPF